MIATAGRPTRRQRLANRRLGDSTPEALAEEQRRAAGYPISRWYVRPAAGWLAARLAATRVRPAHLTACGLIVGLSASALLCWQPQLGPVAALLVLAAWFFDRADGQLARRQGTASAWGAWLDANVDELLDVAWHVALAWAAARQSGTSWPWLLVLAFVAGKYLFMHGLATEKHETPESEAISAAPGSLVTRLARTAWHLPGNADVRLHLLVAALATGCLTAELAIVAAYYNLRWMVRYRLVARRLGGCP